MTTPTPPAPGGTGGATANTIERAVVAAFPFLIGGVVAAPVLLVVPQAAEPLLLFTLHLAALVGLGLGVTLRIAALADAPWFTGHTWWSARRRTFLAAVVLVVVSTGVVGLVSLATAAALRLDPSLQFLQLLSALDIAWAGAAIVLAVRWLRGRGSSVAAGIVLGGVCVWSVWNYLRIVGFGPGGGWRVDGAKMMQLVLPVDMAAAAVAVSLLVVAVRRRT